MTDKHQRKLPIGEQKAEPPPRRIDPGEYTSRKRAYQDAHRLRIFDRDGRRCRLCGRMTRLEMAHITPAIEFWSYDRAGGLERSYRDDNLVTLCAWCHRCHDRPGEVPEPTRLQVLRDERWCHILGGSPNALVDRFSERIGWLEEEHRAKVHATRKRVVDLFEDTIRARGWRTAVDLALLEAAQAERTNASAA